MDLSRCSHVRLCCGRDLHVCAVRHRAFWPARAEGAPRCSRRLRRLVFSGDHLGPALRPGLLGAEVHGDAIMTDARRDLVLWTTDLGPPIVWLFSFQANFTLAPWACVFQVKAWLSFVFVLALMLELGL